MTKPANKLDKIQPIYKAYWSDLCGFIQSRFGTPPEPEDVAQATFLKFADLDDPDAIESPKAYLYKTARNLIVDYHRSPKNVLATEDQMEAQEFEKSSDVWEPEHVLMNRQEARIVEDIIMGLSERDRAFVLMHRLEDMTYTEIAARANMSRAGVQKIITQAIDKCMQALKERTDV